ALGQTGDGRAVPPLLAALAAGHWGEDTVQALVRIGDPQAVQPLIAALKSKDERVRYEAALALREFRDPGACGPLIAALGDPAARVRQAVGHALYVFEDPRAIEPLIKVVANEAEVGVVRANAGCALGSIRVPQAARPRVLATFLAVLRERG